MMTSQSNSRFLLALILFTGVCQASNGSSYFKEGERIATHVVDSVIFNKNQRLDSVVIKELLKEFALRDPKSVEFKTAFSHLKTVLRGFKKEFVRRLEPIAVTKNHKAVFASCTQWLDVFINSATMATFIGDAGRAVSALSKVFAEKSAYGKFKLPILIQPDTQSEEYAIGESFGRIGNSALILAIQEASREEFSKLTAAAVLLQKSYNNQNPNKLFTLTEITTMLSGIEKGFQENSLDEALSKSHNPFKAHLIRLASHIPLRCMHELFSQAPLHAIVNKVGQEITQCGKDLEAFV